MKPSFKAGVIYDKKCFFSDNYVNALMIADLGSGNCKYICEFPDEELGIHLLHEGAVKYKDKIVFTPGQGEHIHIYDMNNMDIYSVKIQKNSKSRYAFSGCIMVDQSVWILPGNTKQNIIIYNIEKKICTKVDSISAILKDCYSNEKDAFWKWSLIGENIYSALQGSNKVIVVNTKSGKANVIETEVGQLDYFYVTGEKKWLCSRNKIYGWDEKNNKCINYPIDNYYSCNETIRVCGNENVGIFLLPSCGGVISELNNNQFTKNIYMKIKRTPNDAKGYGYTESGLYDDEILMYPPYGKECIIIGPGRTRIVELNVVNQEDVFHKYEKCFKNLRGGILHEGGVLNLNDYVAIIGE